MAPLVYDVGDQAVLAWTLASDATVIMTVTKPDGSTLTPTPTHPGTGQYQATITLDQAGLWLYRWVATGAVTQSDDGQVTVRASALRIVSLAEAKAHLGKSSTVTVDDDELRGFIDAAGAVIDRLAGAVMPRQVIDYLDGGGHTVSLLTWPVLSVTQVIERWVAGASYTLTALPDIGAGTATTGYDYQLDAAAGVIERYQSWVPVSFPAGRANIKVTYTAGRRSVPDNIRLATLELLLHLWRSSQLARGGTRPSVVTGAGDEGVTYRFGYAVPNRVLELLGTDRLPPAVA